MASSLVCLFLASVQAATLKETESNAMYPLAQLHYHCSSKFYVNVAIGNDRNSGTAPRMAGNGVGPWRTIARATYRGSVFKAGACVNVAPGLYHEDVYLMNAHKTAGNRNSDVGYAVLRCDVPAQPYLFALTRGRQGSNPACIIDTKSDNPYAVVSWNANYAILDGFDITSSSSQSTSISRFAYDPSSGLVTLTLTSPASLNPQMGFSVSGLSGTGSISLANGYFFAGTGSNGTTTLTYQIRKGLSLSNTNGGTVAYVVPSSGSYGISTPLGNPKPAANHIAVLNSRIHDTGGAGIASLFADYIYVFGNVVFNTAWTNGYDTSGISLVANVDSADESGTWDGIYGAQYKKTIYNVVANNISHNNGNIVEPFTDGNGIIIDTLDGVQTGCTVSRYSYGTLVYGNVVFRNGGRGIHVFYSDDVAILNNTAYEDNQSTLNHSTTRAEIDSFCGSENTVQNNIGLAVTANGYLSANVAGGSWNGQNNGKKNFWNHNIFQVIGDLFECRLGGASGDGIVCYNGFDTILGKRPSLWKNGVTYSIGNVVLGADSNAYVSLADGNLNNNPVTDGGDKWQNNGRPDNSYPSDPKFEDPSSPNPNLMLGPNSPALGASSASVTKLGGPVVFTPNIGAH